MGEPEARASFARDVALLQAASVRCVVVHGGGPMIAELLAKLEIPTRFEQGLRVTDEAIVEASGKMQVLDRLLPKLKANGHRVVLFSQFTTVLDLLDDYLRMRGYRFCRLDGGTNRVQRTIDINSFNAPGSPIFVFLMSTRAGGLGINLTAADTVFFLEHD